MNHHFPFPDITLQPGKVSDTLSRFQIQSFHEAVEWIWKLPYGRNSDRTNYLLVPQELQGACSTKHAFLAALAEEQDVDLKLMATTRFTFTRSGLRTGYRKIQISTSHATRSGECEKPASESYLNDEKEISVL